MAAGRAIDHSSMHVMTCCGVCATDLFPKDMEVYLSKDVETRETLRRLWKKFHQLPRDFSLGYAKAVNEIIAEKKLKNVNHDNLNALVRKACSFGGM